MADEAELLLTTPLGLPGSGRLRYAGAAALYRAGRIGAEALEVWRIASALDGLDPALLLAERGLAPPALSPPAPEALLRRALAEADSYLAPLPGPGIAETRAGIAARRDAAFAGAAGAADPLAARHLPAALAALRASHPLLAASLAAAAPHLRWHRHDPGDRDHAHAPLLGPEAALRAEGVELGLLLLAPHLRWHDRTRTAPELCVSLTGPHRWRLRPGAPLVEKPAHAPVWTPPHQPRLIETGALPLLALVARMRGPDAPARRNRAAP